MMNELKLINNDDLKRLLIDQYYLIMIDHHQKYLVFYDDLIIVKGNMYQVRLSLQEFLELYKNKSFYLIKDENNVLIDDTIDEAYYRKWRK